jgi:hypothetical protein
MESVYAKPKSYRTTYHTLEEIYILVNSAFGGNLGLMINDTEYLGV